MTRIPSQTIDEVQSLYAQLGFAALRDIQEAAIVPILRGENCLLIAPTSGGKTEAALVPLLAKERNRPQLAVSILYLAPMRALINDLEPRLRCLARTANIEICKWHSDVSKVERSNFVKAPTNILLTTPESLESFLLFQNDFATHHFSNIQCVIVDEFHAYAGNDRGAHLLALLERLRIDYTGDFQRIALSATVGNPKGLCAALGANSKRKNRVVATLPLKKSATIRIRYADKDNVFKSVIDHVQQHPKHLIFTETRQSVEGMGSRLKKSGIQTLITHSSLPADHREKSEKHFSNTSDQSMVATCALEMGIDIGDLEHIIQINAPRTVSSYLQRRGRAGRRQSLTQNFSFICRHGFALLQATALTMLHERGFIEPIVPLSHAAHLAAQQLLCMAFSKNEIRTAQATRSICQAVPFKGLNKKHFETLIEYMRHTGYLANDSLLKPGKTARRDYGGAQIRNLCSDFQTAFEYTVLHNFEEIGRLDALFVFGQKEGEFRFTLAARNWLATKIDHRRHLVTVERTKTAFDSVWTGPGIPLSFEVCQCMHQVLTTNYCSPHWEPSAHLAIPALRSKYSFLTHDGIELKRNYKKEWCLHTFAGGKANALIAQTLTHLWKIPAVHSNFDITFLRPLTATTIQTAVKEMKKQKRPNSADARSDRFPIPTNISKFETCLPDSLKRLAWAEQLFDVESAQKTVKKKLSVVGR